MGLIFTLKEQRLEISSRISSRPKFKKISCTEQKTKAYGNLPALYLTNLTLYLIIQASILLYLWVILTFIWTAVMKAFFIYDWDIYLGWDIWYALQNCTNLCTYNKTLFFGWVNRILRKMERLHRANNWLWLPPWLIGVEWTRTHTGFVRRILLIYYI